MQLTTAVQPRGWPAHWFSFGFAWLIVAVVVYGFAQTLSQNLLYPPIPQPRILWIHAAVFFGWIGLFMVQTTLIRSRRIRWHRRLGVALLGLGAMMPVIGIATMIAMTRFDVAHGLANPVEAVAFLSIPLNDLIFFSSALALAAYWRKRPDLHRRLMLVATCLLTAAAFSRFPFITIKALRWYAGVDALLLLAVAHDLLTTRRVHQVYLVSLPLVLIGQSTAMWLYLARPHWWIAFAQLMTS